MRWFGELGGDPATFPLGIDLTRVDSAVAWAAELRRAFDAAEVTAGEPARSAAWRALRRAGRGGARGIDDDRGRPGGPFRALADAVARWIPALARLAEAVGIDAPSLAAGRITSPRCASASRPCGTRSIRSATG